MSESFDEDSLIKANAETTLKRVSEFRLPQVFFKYRFEPFLLIVMWKHRQTQTPLISLGITGILQISIVNFGADALGLERSGA